MQLIELTEAANAPPAGSLVLIEAAAAWSSSRRTGVVRAWRTHDSPSARRRTQAEFVEQIVAPLIDGRCDPPIGVGPVVGRPDGAAAPAAYFVIVANDAEPFVSLAGGEDQSMAEALRLAVVNRLTAVAPLVQVWSFISELELAEWAQRRWPGAMTDELVKAIRAERKANRGFVRNRR